MRSEYITSENTLGCKKCLPLPVIRSVNFPLWLSSLFFAGVMTTMTIMFYRGMVFNALMCRIGLLYLKLLFAGKTMSQLLDYNDRPNSKQPHFGQASQVQIQLDYPTLPNSFFLCLSVIDSPVKLMLFVVQPGFIFFADFLTFL